MDTSEYLGLFLDESGESLQALNTSLLDLERSPADPEALAEQMRRVAGLAHRVVWANPHQGHADYEPVQQGIVAALPYVDTFVAGHSLAAFAELLEVVADA